jgi:hypothetical protein
MAKKNKNSMGVQVGQWYVVLDADKDGNLEIIPYRVDRVGDDFAVPHVKSEEESDGTTIKVSIDERKSA